MDYLEYIREYQERQVVSDGDMVRILCDVLSNCVSVNALKDYLPLDESGESS